MPLREDIKNDIRMVTNQWEASEQQAARKKAEELVNQFREKHSHQIEELQPMRARERQEVNEDTTFSTEQKEVKKERIDEKYNREIRMEFDAWKAKQDEASKPVAKEPEQASKPRTPLPDGKGRCGQVRGNETRSTTPSIPETVSSRTMSQSSVPDTPRVPGQNPATSPLIALGSAPARALDLALQPVAAAEPATVAPVVTGPASDDPPTAPIAAQGPSLIPSSAAAFSSATSEIVESSIKGTGKKPSKTDLAKRRAAEMERRGAKMPEDCRNGKKENGKKENGKKMNRRERECYTFIQPWTATGFAPCNHCQRDKGTCTFSTPDKKKSAEEQAEDTKKLKELSEEMAKQYPDAVDDPKKSRTGAKAKARTNKNQKTSSIAQKRKASGTNAGPPAKKSKNEVAEEGLQVSPSPKDKAPRRTSAEKIEGLQATQTPSGARRYHPGKTCANVLRERSIKQQSIWSYSAL